MRVDLRHNPGFGAARLTLGGGESARVEAGAMAAHSAGMTLQAKMQGGFLSSLKRAALGGNSFFVTTYTAPAEGGWVDVASPLPGDMHVVELTPGRALVTTHGAWLAGSDTVELDTKWGGFGQLAGGEDGFLVHATGTGTVVLAAYGALDALALRPGESVTVDSGHVVAFDEGVRAQLRRAASGSVQSMESGEGLVFDLTGPGTVLVQTHNPSQLVSWLAARLPNRS